MIISKSEVIEDLKDKGWTELKGVFNDFDLLNIASKLGQVFKRNNGNVIEILRPSNGENSIKGTFSNIYKYSEFPLHTDMAFYIKPIRYMLLASNERSNCNTFLLPFSDVFKLMKASDKKNFDRAIYIVKTRAKHFFSPLNFKYGNEIGFKYDSTCMTPFNDSAKKFDAFFCEIQQETIFSDVRWTGNKLVLIDNWSVLHGRNSANNELNREVKRIYII